MVRAEPINIFGRADVLNADGREHIRIGVSDVLTAVAVWEILGVDLWVVLDFAWQDESHLVSSPHWLICGSSLKNRPKGNLINIGGAILMLLF